MVTDVIHANGLGGKRVLSIFRRSHVGGNSTQVVLQWVDQIWLQRTPTSQLLHFNSTLVHGRFTYTTVNLERNTQDTYPLCDEISHEVYCIMCEMVMYRW